MYGIAQYSCNTLQYGLPIAGAATHTRRTAVHHALAHDVHICLHISQPSLLICIQPQDKHKQNSSSALLRKLCSLWYRYTHAAHRRTHSADLQPQYFLKAIAIEFCPSRRLPHQANQIVPPVTGHLSHHVRQASVAQMNSL